MAKKKNNKKVITSTKPNHSGCKLGFVLMGIIMVVLGVGLYLDYMMLEQVVAIVLIIWGIKKVYMAAKCC